jgi:peptide/nickel transport system substrate-binding protein
MNHMIKIMVLMVAAAALIVGNPPDAAAQGNLTVAITSTLNSLDPAKATGREEYVYNVLAFSGLTTMGHDYKIRGDLAERWEASSDFRQWTFYLRKGARFHNGREVEAADVIASFEHIRAPATGSPAASHFEIVDSMVALDSHTVRFNLKLGYSGWADLMIERQLKIVPRDLIDKLPTQPIGSGPFKFKSYTPGDRLELVKNADYFEPGVPRLDSVTLRIMPETAARISALAAGDVQMIYDVPLESIERLRKTPNVTVDVRATSSWEGMILNNSRPPFKDVRVRQAVNFAIDKGQLITLALSGQGEPTNSPIAPTHPFFKKTLKHQTDIAQARKLLAEAGYPNGFEVDLHVPAGRPVRERLGVAIQQMLRPIGINAKIQRVPWNVFQAEIAGKAAMYTDGYFGRPTIDTSTYPWYHSSGSWNGRTWSYRNEGVDDVLQKARTAATIEEQKKLYLKFQEYVFEDPPGVVCCVLNYADAFRHDVKGYRSHPMQWLDLNATYIEQ